MWVTSRPLSRSSSSASRWTPSTPSSSPTTPAIQRGFVVRWDVQLTNQGSPTQFRETTGGTMGLCDCEGSYINGYYFCWTILVLVLIKSCPIISYSSRYVFILANALACFEGKQGIGYQFRAVLQQPCLQGSGFVKKRELKPSIKFGSGAAALLARVKMPT